MTGVRCKFSVLFVSLILAFSGEVVRAEDSNTDLLSIKPWTGATLVVSNEETKIAVALAYLSGPLRINFEGSVPLDADSEVEGALGKAFTGKVFIGYDSRLSAKESGLDGDVLDLTPTAQLCEAYGLTLRNPPDPSKACTAENLEAKAKENAATYRRVQLHRLFTDRDVAGIFSVGVKGSFDYARIEAFPTTSSPSKSKFDNYTINIGAEGNVVVFPWMLLAVGAGYSGTIENSTEDGESCTGTPEAPECQKGLVLTEKGKFDDQYFVRLGLHLVLPKKVDDVVPAVEFAFNLRNGDYLDTRFSVFFSPVSDPLAVAFGLGFIWTAPLGKDLEPDFTPFALLSGAFGTID